MTILIGSSVAIGGEDDVPEERGRRQEFDGKEGAFLIQLRGPNNVDFDPLLSLGILEDEFGALGQAFGKNDHSAGGTDGVSEAADGIRIASDVSDNGHAQQNALGAAAFFGGGLPVERGAGRIDGARLGVGRRFHSGKRLHSSRPQNSISGAISSTPYSQPSGRELPFQTIMAALLE